MSRIISLRDALPHVHVDVADIIGADARPRLAVLDGEYDETVLGQLPDAPDWMEADRSEQVLLLVGGSVTSLTSDWSDRDAATVECAAALQTFVMDEQNAAWPILRGGAVGTPCVRDGVPCWVSDELSVPIGELSTALRG